MFPESFPVNFPIPMCDRLPMRIYAKDWRGRFTYVNLTCMREMGIQDPAEVLGMTDFTFYQPDLAAKWNEDEWNIIREGVPFVEEEEDEIRKDGTRSWLRTWKFPLQNAAGKTIGILGISKDNTKAHVQEHQYQHLLNTVPSFVFVKQLDRSTNLFTFRFANAALRSAWGSDLLSRSDGDFTNDAEEIEGYRAIDEEIFGGLALSNTRKESFTHRSGERLTLSTTKVALRDPTSPNLPIIGVLGVSTDITELEKKEQDLRRNEELLTRVLDTLPQKVFVKDRKGKFILCNESFARHHGETSKADVINKTDADYWSEEEANRYRTKDGEVMKSAAGAVRPFLETQIWPDGRRMIVETTKVRLADPVTGEVHGVIGQYDEYRPHENREGVKRHTFTHIANQIRISVDDTRRFYLILLGLTHVHGLEFNRALLWRFAYSRSPLHGTLGVGPFNREQALESVEGGALEGIELDECIHIYDRAERAPDVRLVGYVKGLDIEIDPQGDLFGLIRKAEISNKPLVMPFPRATDLGELGKPLADIDAGATMLIVIPIESSETLVITCDNVRSGVDVEKNDELQLYDEFAQIVKRTMEDTRAREDAITKEADARSWQRISYHVGHTLQGMLVAAPRTLDRMIEELKAKSARQDLMGDVELLAKTLLRCHNLVAELSGYAAPKNIDPTEVFAVPEIVHEIEQMFRVQGITAIGRVDPAVTDARVLIDSDGFYQAVSLMVQNVYEIVGPRAQVKLFADRAMEDELTEDELTAESEWIRLSICDDGRGVKAGDKERIFEPGVSIDKHGTGFGLARCRDIFLAHRGRICENGVPGQGAAFRIFLKREQEASS
jgi:PAS domain S-box-containing protein